MSKQDQLLTLETELSEAYKLFDRVHQDYANGQYRVISDYLHDINEVGENIVHIELLIYQAEKK